MLLVDAGRFLEAELRALLASGDWPARNPDRNIADLKAQVAACARGASELKRVAGEYGRAAIDAYMGHVMAYAEEAVRRLIGGLKDGAFAYEMDNGAHVSVTVTVDRREAARRSVDFAGTSAQLADNFNAPYSICRAATLYVFRTLLDDPIPLERRLHAADHAEGAGRLDAQSRIIRPPWSPAMSRPARWSPIACSPLAARWRRARGR